MQQVYQIELSCRNINKESFLSLAQYKEPPIRRCSLRAVDILLLGRAATFQSELLNVNKSSPQRCSLPSLFTGLAFPLQFPFSLLKVSNDDGGSDDDDGDDDSGGGALWWGVMVNNGGSSY